MNKAAEINAATQHDPTASDDDKASAVVAIFSQKRMIYHQETGRVDYQSKDGEETKVFDPLEWLAAIFAMQRRASPGPLFWPRRKWDGPPALQRESLAP